MNPMFGSLKLICMTFMSCSKSKFHFSLAALCLLFASFFAEVVEPLNPSLEVPIFGVPFYLTLHSQSKSMVINPVLGSKFQCKEILVS